ncbi:MAG: ATP-dependent helicase, partial [Bacteroidia bacterium]|nr:ATP-dependent helicase [Bacteroidia bacterium]
MATDSAFSEILSRLNSQQRKAVDTIEGPVMVIAGPGTGKTQILAARIANILQQTDTSAHQILCLTFTDAGTVAMRERLQQFIGPLAYNVNIYTFHGLCNQIIQENSDYFGIRGLQPVNDIESRDLIKELIDSFPLEHPLRRNRGEKYYDSTNLLNLFSVMKSENLSAEEIAARVDLHLEECKSNDDFYYKKSGKGYKAGDFKQKNFDEICEKLTKLRAASALFPKFTEMMEREKRYDYNDMILWVLKAFNENELMLLRYQERFLYVLVDEYQDTNGAQNELIKLLLNFWDIPNIFIVGDDDQSIYKFQGANIKNILDFKNAYSTGMHTEILVDNYRSSQHILNAAGSLIQRNMERLTSLDSSLNKDLQAKHNEFAAIDIKPSVTEYPNNLHEVIGIADKISALKEKGVKLSEIAILYRNHNQADNLIKYLQIQDIPFNIKRKSDVLKEPLVEKLLMLLEYISLESKRPFSGEHLLYKILHLDFYDIAPLDIALLAAEVRNRRKYFRQELQAIQEAQQGNLFSGGPTGKAEIRRLSNDLEFWIKQSINLTLPQLLEKIIAKGGILSSIMLSPEKTWNMQVMRTFFNFVKEESEKSPGVTLSSFLETIKTMKESDLPLPLNKVTQSKDGVNFITAHGSKGLEFEYVFMMSCQKDKWEKSERGLPFNLSKLYETATAGVSNDEESRRLFYVAMTRAKKHLEISYFNANENGKDSEKSRYVAELIDADSVDTFKMFSEDERVMAFQEKLWQEEVIKPVELLDDALINQMLQNYSLSVTHLNSYLKCPVSFYYNNLLRVPAAKNDAMSFGTSMHAAVEQLFKKMLSSADKEFPGIDIMLKDFDTAMYFERDSFTEKQYKDKMEYGKKTLTDYYNYNLEKWKVNTVVSPERNFVNIQFAGIPIKGKVDKIEFSGNDVNVVDYKTGDFTRIKDKLQPPSEAKEGKEQSYSQKYGGDYWRHIMFYSLLIENDRTN